jgi:hypothetical protein
LKHYYARFVTPINSESLQTLFFFTLLPLSLMKKARISMTLSLVAMALLSACAKDDILNVQDEPQAQSRMMMSDEDVKPPQPIGWEKMSAVRATGINFYSRTNPYNVNLKDYMLEVNLANAEVRNVMASSQVATTQNSNPTFSKWTTSTFWSNRPAGTIAMVNGSFFGSIIDLTTQISLPIKQSNVVITGGTNNCGSASKRRLGFSGYRAYVDPYTVTTTECPTLTTALSLATISAKLNRATETVGYSNTVSSSPTSKTGRNYAGIWDGNNDGSYETLYFVVSTYLTQADMDAILASLSISSSKRVQFDGSGSARVVYDGVAYVNPSRQVPQMFAIIPR